VFKELGDKYGKSPVQIILKWHIQEGFVPLPKSTNPEHIKDNISLDFTLSDEDMEKIRDIDKDTSYFNATEEEQEKMFLSQNIDFDDQK
jgi:diketogulonate reductase-like aldo/keto reductase